MPLLLSLDVFITADEDDQIMFANHFLKSALRGDWSGILILGYPGVPTLILGGVGVGVALLSSLRGLAPFIMGTGRLFYDHRSGDNPIWSV